MENRITTQNDLYKKLKPALRTKKHELILNGIRFVKEIIIKKIIGLMLRD